MILKFMVRFIKNAFVIIMIQTIKKIFAIHVIVNYLKGRCKIENQHRSIRGYRELTQLDIDRMNQVKNMGIELGKLVSELETIEGLDKRWIEIGKTELQQGLMALTRSIAKPDFF